MHNTSRPRYRPNWLHCVIYFSYDPNNVMNFNRPINDYYYRAHVEKKIRFNKKIKRIGIQNISMRYFYTSFKLS